MRHRASDSSTRRLRELPTERSEGEQPSATRVGVICHRGLGGSARVAVNLAGELAARGHDVHLFARSVPPGMATPPSGVTLHLLQDGGEPDHVSTRLDVGWSADELTALVDLICDVVLSVRLDVLHFHYAVPFAWVVHTVRNRLGSCCPALVGTLHGTDVSVLGRRSDVRRRLVPALAGLDALTTVSRSHAALSARVFGLANPPVVIPNFVDPGRFRPAEPRPVGRRPRIVHVSNFRLVKQPESMARIADRVLASAESELWMVGDGEMMPAVESILEARIASGEVRRLGVRLDVEHVLPHTDLLLVTSKLESFCLVALEAMASGVPVVAPRVGGLPELVEHGSSGLLYEPGDEHEATRLILGYLADPDLQDRLRAGACERAKGLSSDVVVPRYERLYREVIGADRSGADVVARAGG